MSGREAATVLTYGTFDLFHHGHVRLLKRAKDLGTELIVGLSTDEFNAQKGKSSSMSYEDRREVVLACRYVDRVIPECRWEQKVHDVTSNSVGVFVMGDDWTGHFDFLKPYCRVIYMPRTPGISSTLLRERAAEYAKLRESM